METLKNKLIIYDSNCKVCTSLKGTILRISSIQEDKIKAYKDLPEEHMKKVDANRFKNVMALIDTGAGQTIYGADGIAYILSSQSKIIKCLLGYKLIYRLFEILYKIQANNRYIMATPVKAYDCDCVPDKNVKYRLAYIGLAIGIATALTALFGMSLTGFFEGLSKGKAATEMILIAGTGWAIQIMAITAFHKEKALEYVGHISSIMVVGLLILVPWMLFNLVTGANLAAVPITSVVASSAYMLYLHIHRLRHLQLSQWWTVSWFLFLQTSAVAWIYYFHF